MSSFQQLAEILSQREYHEYAYKLTGNRQDAEDLVSDFVLHLHKNLAYFQKAEKAGHIKGSFKSSMRNLFIDAKRCAKDIDPHEAQRIGETREFNDKQRRALAKLAEDINSNEYHRLLFRRSVEFGVPTLSETTGVSPQTLRNGLNRYKSDIMNIKKILLIADTTGVGYHRILKPYAELSEDRNDILLTRSNAYINRDHDIVIFNRLCGASYEDDRAIMKEMKVCGQKIIVDIDDYWHLPPGHLLENYYKVNRISKRIEQNIREADLVTTTNEVLALKILKVNKNVVILPNALKLSDTQWQDHKVKEKPYRFGFIGSRAHTNDIPLLRKACNRMHRSDYDFKFIFMGWAGEDDPASRLFEEVLSARGTGNNRYGKIAAKGVTEYGLAYNLVDCALAPLEDNLFNRCKSNLKILEAAAHKMPIICSKIHPYYVGGDFDKCVLFAEKELDWFNHMADLVKNPQKGRDMGEKMNQILTDRFTYKVVNKLRNEII